MDSDEARLTDLEAQVGVMFADPSLLRLAVNRVSGSVSAGESLVEVSNERLEFLGDAILGAAAAAYLYRTHPELAEGPLTALRSALVRRSTATLYANDLELYTYVYVSRAEEGPRGRGADSVLSAAFEAVIGAVYLDQGFEAAAHVLERLFERHLPRILEENGHHNAKSLLQEYTQARSRITPRYSLLDRQGPAHDSLFVVEVVAEPLGSERGSGPSRRQAEQEAAQMLLAHLQRQEEDRSVDVSDPLEGPAPEA